MQQIIGEPLLNIFTSRRMYKRYQEMYKDFCKQSQVPMNCSYSDTHLVRFFNQMKKSYAQSILRVIYSCINRWFITTLGKKLNHIPRELFSLGTHLTLICIFTTCTNVLWNYLHTSTSDMEGYIWVLPLNMDLNQIIDFLYLFYLFI